MSIAWIKEANKIGKYERSHKGFRFYCTLEPKVVQRTEVREDGTWNITDFIKGWYVAIDRYGVKFEAAYMETLWDKIEWEMAARYCNKRETREIRKPKRKYKDKRIMI